MVNKKKSCTSRISSKKEEDQNNTSEKPGVDQKHEPSEDGITKDSKMTAGTTVTEKNKRVRDDESQGIVVQSSGRISKRPKWDYDPYSPPKRTAYAKKQASKANTGKPETKKRTCSFWTTHEKDNFFEALKEHGRDWKALHSYMKRHNRGKDVPENVPEKTPEHIRQFYYRAWHKIAKYLVCPEGVDRQALEIFGLICYGEFRKRIGIYNMDATNGEKLNEMVYKGVTTIRHRKPGCRKVKYIIRTPRCTMLRKLNNLEGIKLHQRRPTTTVLPREIVVELRPKNNETWAHVQSISQNPRIKTKVDPERRLSSFIDYMNKKWKSLRLRMKESMREKEKPEQELKLYPPPSCTLSPWDVTRLKPVKNNPDVQKLGLETYMRILENMSSPTVPKNVKKSGKSQTQESKSGEQIDQAQSHKSDSNQSKGNADVHINKFKDKNVRVGFRAATNSKSVDSVESNPLSSENPFAALGVSNEASSKGSTNDSMKTHAKSELSSSPESRSKSLKKEPVDTARSNASVDKPIAVCDAEKESGDPHEDVVRKLEVVRAGMTHKAAQEITVADLYFMMGMPEKIVIEYEWVDLMQKTDYLNLGELANMLRRLVDLARTQSLEIGKSKCSQQASVKQDEQFTQCTCGAYNKVNTPPNSKRTKRGLKKESLTPKGSKKVSREVASDDGSSGSLPQASLECVQSPPGMRLPVVAAEELQQGVIPANSAPPMSSSHLEETYEFPLEYSQYPFPYTHNPNTRNNGVFKVPVSVAPRPTSQQQQQQQPHQSSPITVNNIAQKLSPTALMERINQANKHTDIFLPPRRQRKSRLRRPMVIQRRILPKPFLGASPATYIQEGSQYVVQTTKAPTEGGQVIKVMNPADLQSVTLKSLVTRDQHLPQVPLRRNVAADGMNSVTNIDAITPVSSQHQVPQNLHTDSKTNVHFQPQIKTESNSGLVPVASLNDYLAMNNLNTLTAIPGQSNNLKATHTTLTTANQNLITQAAVATGINLDPQEGNSFQGTTDGVLLSINSSSAAATRVGSPPSNISALLDISLPAVTEDSTDKMIDLALQGSNSSFNVSALLDSSKSNDALQKDANLGMTVSRLHSPSQLSPSKLFKTISTPPDEPWLGGEDFNLSSFLSDSPIKKPTSASATSQPAAAASSSSVYTHAVLTSVPLLSESSRDSVIGRTFDISVVDGTLQSMMNENSLDYMSKFADLAREIGAAHSDERHKPGHG